MLLPVPDQRAAVDLAADPLLHHLPPVELQARVHRVHALGGQVPRWAGPGWGQQPAWSPGPGPRAAPFNQDVGFLGVLGPALLRASGALLNSQDIT